MLPLFIASYNSKEKSESNKQSNKKSAETDFHFDGYPVYSISKNIDAITLELDNYGEENLFQNKIFKEVDQQDSLINNTVGYSLKPLNSICIDTLGALNIFQNLKLEEKIKAKLRSTYYIYGKKGVCRITVGNIYFTVDECFSNIIGAEIKQYNREKCGFPLFCSEKPLKLEYGKDYKKAEQKINKFIEKVEADYSNKPGATKVFANIDSYYFTYEDDFIWGFSPNKSEINFPSRAIYHIDEKGKVTSVWVKSLDLFGIPCD